MIAQVFATTGPTGTPTDEFRKFSEDALGQGRKMDGCEATLSLTDPNTGKGLVVNLSATKPPWTHSRRTRTRRSLKPKNSPESKCQRLTCIPR